MEHRILNRSPINPASLPLAGIRILAFVLILGGLTGCETFSVPGMNSEASKFDSDLPELSPSRLKITSLEGTIDRKAELKMLTMKSRSATADSGETGYVPAGAEERALVMVHRTKDGMPARVRLVQGTEKLTYTDTAYFDEGELFHYVSEFSHSVRKEGYSKAVVMADEYQIMNGSITDASTVTKTKVREQGRLLKDDAERGALSGRRLSLEEIEQAVGRRMAFVDKKIGPVELLAKEER